MNLEANASTSRTLNLISVWKNHGEEADYAAQPLFRHSPLNKSIIVKHRLRPNERDVFEDGRQVGTKVILPLDITNLNSGARSFFVRQRGYEEILAELLYGDARARQYDERLLSIISDLPSLDPFLMREHLRRAGIQAARCYFDMTKSDASRIFQFVTQEVAPLIGMSLSQQDSRLYEQAAKMAQMLMTNATGQELEPLRQGLGMDKQAFDEGMFCWKGFIYYKWMLSELSPRVKPVSTEISQIRHTGPANPDDLRYISMSRTNLSKAVFIACETVRLTLKVYDEAFADLTQNSQPLAFRKFLLNAPNLFFELGERIGAVEHILSFWRFRFPPNAPKRISAEELVDLFLDFETSINFNRSERAA